MIAEEITMLTLHQLAARTIEAISDDPRDIYFSFDMVFDLLDVEGSRNEHLANPLNHPRSDYFRRRERPHRGDEIVNGEFLSLRYCGYDPFVLLRDHDDLASLEQLIVSSSGPLNPFITFLVAFISGKVVRYQITYRSADGRVLRFDPCNRPSETGRFLDDLYPNRAIEWL
jgi:hypothetical protein